jgi:hypothetical protein
MTLNNNRIKYIEYIINKYDNVYLNWDRQTGKTTHLLYYIYCYANKNPNSKILIVSPNSRVVFNNIGKITEFGYIFQNINNKKIVFNNFSEIQFVTNLDDDISCNYDIVLLDDIDWYSTIFKDTGSKSDPIMYIFQKLHIINTKKLLISGYDTKIDIIKMTDIEKYLNKKVFIDYYKDDNELNTYLRRKKINKLLSKIKV